MGTGLCWLEREGLKFLVPISEEGEPGHWVQSCPSLRRKLQADWPQVNPVFAFSFLSTILSTLEDYLGDLTETSIKDNFDTVYMVCSIRDFWLESAALTCSSAH